MNNFDLLYRKLPVICERKPFRKFLADHINLIGQPVIIVNGTVYKLEWKNIPGGLIQVNVGAKP